MEPFVTIKIKQFVKYKLDKARKDINTSEFMDQMLTFFEVTMTNPRDVQTYPLVEMKKEIQGIGKKVNGLEKGVINAILAEIRKLGNVQPSIPESSAPSEVTNEMIIEVATQNELLETQLAAEREKVIKLSTEITQLNNELKKAPQYDNSKISQFEDLFKWLKTAVRSGKFTDDYLISGPAYKEFITRLETLTQSK